MNPYTQVLSAACACGLAFLVACGSDSEASDSDGASGGSSGSGGATSSGGSGGTSASGGSSSGGSGTGGSAASGGSGGSATGGSAGAGNTEECPATLPEPGDTCEPTMGEGGTGSVGEVCEYGDSACFCVIGLWACFDNSGCPEEQPMDDDSCANGGAIFCQYGETSCGCQFGQEAPTWSCE